MPAAGGGDAQRRGAERGSVRRRSGSECAAPSAAERSRWPHPISPSVRQQQAQRNGVPGVMLQSDIHQQTSATFTSKGQNVHLPDGTQMDVALAVVPAGVRIQ